MNAKQWLSNSRTEVAMFVSGLVGFFVFGVLPYVLAEERSRQCVCVELSEASAERVQDK